MEQCSDSLALFSIGNLRFSEKFKIASFVDVIITVRHFCVCLYESERERILRHCQVEKQPISISHPILGRRYSNYERRFLLSSLPHPHIPWESLLAGYGPLDKKRSHKNRPHSYILFPPPPNSPMTPGTASKITLRDYESC